MLCAPVTYEAELRQLICLPLLAPQFGDRYVNPAMFALTGHPALHCSTTRTKSRRSRPGTRLPPKCVSNVPTPASSSSRFVAVEDHVACRTR
jgi:hypothetical protein